MGALDSDLRVGLWMGLGPGSSLICTIERVGGGEVGRWGGG